MLTIDTNYPTFLKQYIYGIHIVRGTDFKGLGGAFVDQGIEQTLKHDLNYEVRLTRGRECNSLQRNLLVFSRPFCVGFTDALEKLSSWFFLCPVQKGTKEA